MPEERQDSVREWFASNALRVVTGVLLALLGWVLADRLGDVKLELRALNQTTREVLIEQRGQDTRLRAAEQANARQDSQIEALEKEQTEFWRNYGSALNPRR